ARADALRDRRIAAGALLSRSDRVRPRPDDIVGVRRRLGWARLVDARTLVEARMRRVGIAAVLACAVAVGCEKDPAQSVRIVERPAAPKDERRPPTDSEAARTTTSIPQAAPGKAAAASAPPAGPR